MSALALEFSADGCGAGSHFEKAEHIEAEDEHEQEKDDDHPRILELIAPALEFGAGLECGGADAEKDAAEDTE